MFSEQSSPLSMAIACAVLQPMLRSLLIFDAPFAGLQQVALQMVEVAALTGQKLRPIVLSSSESDDDLWGERLLPDGHGKIARQAQIFSPLYESEDTLLIIVPDLSALSLAAARASIMLVGANVAHLERHGQQKRWLPRCYWLASCRHEVVNTVSEHLLDRFALRLSWRNAETLTLSHQERIRVLQKNMQPAPSETLPPLDTTDMQHIKQAVQHPPLVEITAEASECIVTYQEGEIFHQRRELALARCSLALAQLAGETQLRISYVEQAAELMGLQKHNADTSSNTKEPDLPTPANDKHEKTIATPQRQTASPTQPESLKRNIEVQTQEPAEQPHVSYVVTASNPYPEDTEPILRELASLQQPQRHLARLRSDRGPIIGVEPSTTLRDLAFVSTLMHALRFQTFRRESGSTAIVLDWTDLHKYRRAAAPERLLLLLLDYTSVSLIQRQRELVPYLSQAYVERAGITIIKVGAVPDGAKSGLQAQSVSARNILVPAISAAIDAPAGNATPLAHGLELAMQIMQRTLQHGRSAVQHITFVVVSDGRGNVPLQASHSNTITPPIMRAGVEDALQKAQEIGNIKHITSIVLAPRLRYYQDLPLRLADALHAQFIPIQDEGDGLV